MEVIRVGIALDDRCFARALVRGLARECKAMMFVLLDGEEQPDCDLILTSQSSEEKHVVQLVRLCGQDRLEQPPFRLYRYYDSRRMVESISFIYYRLTGVAVDYHTDEQCKVVLFAAGAGRCGTTVTALAVSRMIWKLYGKRGLYLNLCPLNDSAKYLSCDGEERFLRLLYYLDTEKDFPLDSFIRSEEEMGYIPAPLVNPYFHEVDAEVLRRLLEKLKTAGQYDFLVLDVGNHLERRNTELLYKADAVVFLWDDRAIFPGKYAEAVFREIKEQSREGMFIPVHNFAEDDRQIAEGEFCISAHAELTADCSDGVFAIPLTKSYGIEITALAEKLTEVLS